MACLTPCTKVHRFKVDGRTYLKTISYPCGKCYNCLQRERYRWVSRLALEFAVCSSANFITLTYDDQHLPSNSCLNKDDVTNFLRKFIPHDKKRTIKYFLVGEYGFEMDRPHYHIIFYNLNMDTFDIHNKLLKCWDKGNVDVRILSMKLINYITKYIIKDNSKCLHSVMPFRLMSRNLGFSTLRNSDIKYMLDNRTPSLRLPFNQGTFRIEKQFLIKYLTIHPELNPYGDLIFSLPSFTPKRVAERFVKKYLQQYSDDYIDRQLDLSFKDNNYQYFEYQKMQRNQRSSEYTDKLKRVNKHFKI